MLHLDQDLWNRKVFSEPPEDAPQLGVLFYRNVPFVPQRVRSDQGAGGVAGVGVRSSVANRVSMVFDGVNRRQAARQNCPGKPVPDCEAMRRVTAFSQPRSQPPSELAMNMTRRICMRLALKFSRARRRPAAMKMADGSTLQPRWSGTETEMQRRQSEALRVTTWRAKLSRMACQPVRCCSSE